MWASFWILKSFQHARVESNGNWMPKWKSAGAKVFTILYSELTFQPLVMHIHTDIWKSPPICQSVESLHWARRICSGTRVVSLSLWVWYPENWVIFSGVKFFLKYLNLPLLYLLKKCILITSFSSLSHIYRLSFWIWLNSTDNKKCVPFNHGYSSDVELQRMKREISFSFSNKKNNFATSLF